MIDLVNMTLYGRKVWAKKKYDDYIKSETYKAIDEATKVYYEPLDKKVICRIEKSKWKTAIDRKVNYLFARPPISTSNQKELSVMLDFIKESAREYLLRGSLIWLVQGTNESLTPRPTIMDDTIAVYGDAKKEEPICYIRKYIKVEADSQTGAEEEIEYFECYYDTNKKDTYSLARPTEDKQEVLESKFLFIEMAKTGRAPLYAYVKELLEAYDRILRHQDTATEKNTKPLVEVRGYQGTSDEDIEYAVNQMSIVKTDGNGGVNIIARSMDSTSIDLWAKRILLEFYEATATVGKENELAYAQSGKAMDRLFIDMENSARDLASVLESALGIYFSYIGKVVDIIWNTDRPVDDLATIQGIQASVGILSTQTLIEQHPWVNDSEEELRRLQAEKLGDFTDLYEPTNTETEEPLEEE